MNRPRLLVLTSTYPRWAGDTEPGFVHELAKRLVGRFDVEVICPHATGSATRELLDGVRVRRYRYAPSRWETLVNDGGIVTNLRRNRWKWLLVPAFLLSMQCSTLMAMFRWRPDIVHAHWLIPQGLVGALAMSFRRQTPLLVTSHGADLFALKSGPLEALKRLAANRASAITVVSEAMREELARMEVDVEKVFVQPMGVDMSDRFRPDPAVARSASEILFVGRLVEKKGLMHLIDAMPRVLAVRPDAILTVAGFGPELSERRGQAEALGLGQRVRFVGPVPQTDLPALFRRAAVFVAPFVQASSGDREGLGLVCVEAAACGCPIVVSDVPAIRQVFDESDPAVRVPSGDVGALAEALISILSNPPGAAAVEEQRVRLYASFNWTRVADEYAERLYETMAIDS